MPGDDFFEAVFSAGRPAHTGSDGIETLAVFIVRLNDVEGLGDAMLRLANDAPARERMGQAGRSLCLERFDHHRMVQAITELYHHPSPATSATT